MQTTTKKPASVEILFLRHSKARVIIAASERFTGQFDTTTGRPVMTRRLQDVDVIANEAKKWARK